jgi:hypothetical protein
MATPGVSTGRLAIFISYIRHQRGDRLSRRSYSDLDILQNQSYSDACEHLGLFYTAKIFAFGNQHFESMYWHNLRWQRSPPALSRLPVCFLFVYLKPDRLILMNVTVFPCVLYCLLCLYSHERTVLGAVWRLMMSFTSSMSFHTFRVMTRPVFSSGG